VDVDKNTEASAHFAIQSMPTFKVLNSQGVEVFTKSGGSEAVVKEVIAKALSL
jgi:thioredoxin-like negative regulator of GroEL